MRPQKKPPARSTAHGSAWYAWRVRQQLQAGGENLLVVKRPTVLNQGYLTLGRDCVLRSDLHRLRLAVSPGARLQIGDRVHLHGAIIAATTDIRIGNDTWLAPYAHLMDSDFHDLQDRTQAGQSAPIRIGERVKIGARVIILRGVSIGDDAEIAPASLVTKDIPAGAYASGVPAKVQSIRSPSD